MDDEQPFRNPVREELPTTRPEPFFRYLQRVSDGQQPTNVTTTCPPSFTTSAIVFEPRPKLESADVGAALHRLCIRSAKMRRILFIAVLMVSVSFLALGQTPDTKIEGKTQDEAEIRKLMEDLTVAWNKHDVAFFSMVFAKDADFTNWRGTLRIHGVWS
jgi:hypothetical protein